MTIIRPMRPEKKGNGDKLILPLVADENADPSAPNNEELDPEYVDGQRLRRYSLETTLCLLLVALSIVGLGIAGGMYVHRQYFLKASVFRGLCQIPIKFPEHELSVAQSAALNDLLSDNDNPDLLYQDSNDDDAMDTMMKDINEFDHKMMKDFFQERFEIDMSPAHEYEKVEVPDFRDGRSGRFVHDFNANLTGIVDIKGGRCFVMPMNRDTVVPPSSMFDIIMKLSSGYYRVDTRVLRQNWRVVLPQIDVEDRPTEVGTYINNECSRYPVYKLEKYVSGVVKRSAELTSDAKFAVFSGKRVVEFDIVNFSDVENYESAHL